MKFFYDIKAQANKENVIKFLITSNAEKAGELTVDMLNQNADYAEFAKQKFNRVYVNYVIYSFDETKVNPPETEDIESYLKSLIESKQAARVTTGELEITPKTSSKGDKSKGGKSPKKPGLSGLKAKIKWKKIPKLYYAIAGGAAALMLAIGVGVGMSFGGGNGSIQIVDNLNYDTEHDGLIIPDIIEFDPNAELITVSIDRSYSAIPKEDVQVKGEVVEGVATITLPQFDRNEFFSHVPGHTWGFTSVPDGKKIEYYGGLTYHFTENVKLYRVLVKYGGGNGTKDDPYLINYFDQLQLMSEEKARGYFRQTADIEFPIWANHTPIDTVNELKQTPDLEHFEYDGGGYIIEGLTAPLFGTVSGSVIKNVNITGSTIESDKYSNYGFIVCQAFNYRYQVNGVTYETGETLIQNSSVSHSAIHLQAIPVTDENGNIVETIDPVPAPSFDIELTEDELETYIPPTPPKHGENAIGGISGVGGQIENCYVANLSINAELKDYFLYVGGISGKPANVINSGVNYLIIEGNIFHAGGIVGSAGGTRLYSANGSELPHFYGGNIQGCFVRSFKAVVENSAGGIAGEASTNSDDALISNSYAMGLDFKVGVFEKDDHERINPITVGISGGVIGTDGNESNGHLITNTVSDSCFKVIGSARKSKIDDTVRIAPLHAFYQVGILDVINRNTVTPNNPKIIFTGSFMFAEDFRNSDEGGSYAFPVGINGLLEIVMRIEQTEEE